VPELFTSILCDSLTRTIIIKLDVPISGIRTGAVNDVAGAHSVLDDTSEQLPESNSPWIRGAPHSGLAMLISRISLRISVGKVGRPPRRRDL
jgi:hypothetical protein